MEEIKMLIKKRASIKSKLTLFEKYVQNCEGWSSSDWNSRTNLIELERRIDNAQRVLLAYDDIQTDIECQAENPEEHYSDRENFERRFYSIHAQATILVERFRVNPVVEKSQSVSQEQFAGVKLPEISLPKFDGNFEHWLEYRDIFESLIHNNTQISEIQKFHYLKASLVGSAAQVIKSLEFSANNYMLAWNSLCDRFNNEPLLVQNHIKAIFNLDNITRESSTKIRTLNDNMSKHLSILNKLGEPTESWDTLIIFIISNKFDINTAREWEKQKSRDRLTTLSDFKEFLRKRADMLETMEAKFNKRETNTRTLVSNTSDQEKTGANTFKSNNRTKYSCLYCKKGHSLFYCTEFLRLAIKDRISKVKQLQLCLNCLRPNHGHKECRWSDCKICQGRHNTVLHEPCDNNVHNCFATIRDNEKNDQISESNNESSSTVTKITHCGFSTARNAILSTAIVQVHNVHNELITARALLDCGSQSSYITSHLCKQLNIPTLKTNVVVSGINNKVSHINNKCDIKIFSTVDSYSFNLSCFLINEITTTLPESEIDHLNLHIPENIRLADPEFFIPRGIDILIGADAFWHLLSSGKITTDPAGPLLQNTRLGWIVAGPLNTFSGVTICGFQKRQIDVQQQLTKFWEVEEIYPKRSLLSAEENLCEKHFIDHLKISDDNRYIVSIPFKQSIQKLGELRDIAIKRFLNLERKLIANEKLKQLYTDFLTEYEHLGHMTKIHDDRDVPEYFMPHHGVLKETNHTTKLRVVFNASAPTSTGVSLNELQMIGPTIQQDLLSIVLRFRMHCIIFSSDIKMMYRQVLVNPDQRNLQKIIWRSDPSKPIETFRLNTVTYGTTAASFLAIRCLHELADEVQDKYPNIAKIIREDMYVDDLLTGTDSIEEAQYLCRKISEIFLSRKFELRKWKSNNHDVIEHLNNDSSTMFEFSANKDHTEKTLGLTWIPDKDTLRYKIRPINEEAKHITKRIILSRISTIFDPLGLLSPCIIIAKTLLQGLWAEKLSWDQNIPDNIRNSWYDFSNALEILNDLSITRRVICNDSQLITLHCFADASTTAYGACVYVVSTNSNGQSESHLLCAKSKVAPLKPLTMPRLELCAALVLSQLLSKVIESTGNQFSSVHCWSDSTIVLGWLRTAPNLLKQFVNNRVAEIQRLTDSFQWRHVPSKDNPADLLSRGVKPQKLIDCDLWWHGPEWLILESSEWPYITINISELPERRTCAMVTHLKFSFPFQSFSTLSKLKRSFAYVRRFIQNCAMPLEQRTRTPLTLIEINTAFDLLIKIAQSESFPDEYARLSSSKGINSSSQLLNLHPFMDKCGLIRVGGRLDNSNYPYSKKHPILLSTRHHLTRLIFEAEHRTLLHAGPQLLLSSIRETFWPVSGRNFARKIVHDCVRCARFSGSNIQPIMGNLPIARVQPSLPFSNVGVDYAGPFLMRDKVGRGGKVVKVWIALFICLSTRAIHLEIILSLTANDFLQAFHRFTSRRGKPNEVFSDNGRTFVRANKDIQLIYKFIQDHSETITSSSNDLGIKWHFIPPNSPHFGGIWEAGVKSCKFHLKRVMGSHVLSYLELETLLIRIEAILNSRPMCPLSSCPDDLSPLTPAHFLIGRPLQVIPEPLIPDAADNRLSKFQQLQKLYQHFWNRWSREYITELQQRKRWKRSSGSLQVDQLVLVKDNNLPPMRWRLGRVISLLPGRDGVNRVATIKTRDGLISRAVTRLCPLPVGNIASRDHQDFQGGGHEAA